MKYIHGTYQEAELPDLGDGEAIDTSLPADPDVKNYSYTVVDGDVYFRENSRMVRPNLNTTAEARIKGMVVSGTASISSLTCRWTLTRRIMPSGKNRPS